MHDIAKKISTAKVNRKENAKRERRKKNIAPQILLSYNYMQLSMP